MSKPPRTCSQCGKPLSDSSPGGRCPSCLLALADEAGDRPEECASRIPCTDPLPRRFGDYDLLRELGRGGMGVVYLAQQRPLNRTVAVKMILGGALAGADAIARFQREAEAAAKLRHPGIITVHDFGEIEGHYYLAMEYVEGRRLSEAAGFGAVPFRDAARWIRELAEIVDYAHQHGVLHRDLKPSNILVDESGRLRITDFGLARRITAADRDGFGAKAEDAELTLTGQALGSPSYMPPEQIEGDRHAFGPGSDVYSLGAILYHLLAGRPPFVAESIGATLRAVQETDPPSLRQFNASIPRDLETLCVRCLDKNPSRRFARAQDLADELGRFLADQPIHTRPAGAMEVAWRWCRRNPRLAVTGAIALAGLLVITVGSPIALHRINTARREAVSRAEAENFERARAESILRKMELREAEEKLANDDAGRGLAILASILRREPAHRAVAERVVNELTLRNWPVLSLPPNELTDAVKWVQPSPDGQRFLAVDRSHRVVILSTANGAPVGRTIEHLASAIPVDRFHDSESALRAIFSPDGRCIGTASYDGTARIWSVETGEPVTPPMSHPRPVAGGSFSPDGRLIATACADGVARIWNAATGQPWPVDNPRIFRHGKAIIFAVFSPDGTRLLTGSADYSAQVWELATGDPIGQRLRHDRELRCGAFSPDGRRVVTGEQTGVVRVWDASSGQSVGADRIHERIVNTAVFSPDGRRILSTSHDQTARLWETDSGRPVGQPLRHRGVVRSALFSRDGTRIVTASEDGTARVWDAETGQPLGEPMPHGGPVWWAEFLPDGARVATASSDRMARIWEIRNGSAFTPTFMTGANVDQCHWSPDQQSLLVVAFEVRWINWSLPIPREIARVHGPGNVISGRFRPDGAVVFVGTQDRGFKLVETVTRKSPASNLDPSARVAGGVFSFDNRWLATLSSSNLVRLWESQNGQVVGEPLVHSAPVGALVFTTDGRLLTGTADGSVCAWEVPSGRLAWTQVGHREAITTLQRDSQGHKALSASRDGSVAIWHLADPGSPRIRLHHQGAIASAAFSTDGKRVVTASADGTARLWHAESGAPIGEPLRHQTRVEYVEFSPDGRRIATASADWTARVWDAATGLPLTTAMTHRGIVHHATFSPDGRWLATSSSDGTARIWPIAALPEGQSIPPWLPELAEAVAGVGWDGAGWTRNTSKDAFQHAEAAIAAGRTHGPLATWAAWWTADRWTRPLAPDLRGSIGSALDAAFRPNDDSLSVLESVDRWHPGHDQVQAQLAIGNAAWKVTNSPALLARLDTLSAGAMALNPDSLLSRWARAAFLDRSARLNEAITAMAGARELASSNAYFWLAYGDQLTRAGRADESATAHDRAVEIVNARTDWGEEGRTQVCYRRALSRARNGEPAELHAMLKIPARDPACSTKLVNLDRFYTVPLHKDRPIPTPYAPTFASLATGPQRLAGIEFDVRGLIGIADAWAKPRFPEIPERIDGIAVHSRCRRLHFLHTAVRSAEIGTTVARYRIRMEDGTIAEFTVVYGKDFIHWTYPPPASRTSDIALPLAWREYLWEDTTSGTATFGHLYLGTWDNPRPEVGVVTVDFLRGSAPVMPFPIAMTAEP